MKHSIAVEHVIHAIVEITRVAFCVDHVDGVLAVACVLRIRAMPRFSRHLDEHDACLPGLAEIV